MMANVKLNASDFCFHLKANIWLHYTTDRNTTSFMSCPNFHRAAITEFLSEHQMRGWRWALSLKQHNSKKIISFLILWGTTTQSLPLFTWLYTYCNENSFALVLIYNELKTYMKLYKPWCFHPLCCQVSSSTTLPPPTYLFVFAFLSLSGSGPLTRKCIYIAHSHI